MIDMTPPASLSNIEARCRAFYAFMVRQRQQEGLKASAILDSANEHSYLVGQTCYLREHAYRPTGIALGCPLPDNFFERRLNRIARLVAGHLSAFASVKGPTFAFVPPEWYHVTLLNRSHFERSKAITKLSEEERGIAQKIIAEVGGGPLELHFNSLLLTSTGRLFVRGYPCEYRFYTLRERLVERLPQLNCQLPIAAHLKLGHILVQLDNNGWSKLLDQIEFYGQYVSTRMIFRQLYTPAGPIEL